MRRNNEYNYINNNNRNHNQSYILIKIHKIKNKSNNNLIFNQYYDTLKKLENNYKIKEIINLKNN